MAGEFGHRSHEIILRFFLLIIFEHHAAFTLPRNASREPASTPSKS